MNTITENSDGSLSWSCQIDREYHRQSTVKGIVACLAVILVVLTVYVLVPSQPGQEKSIWVCLIPIGTVIAIAAPLFWLQYTAADPHEGYSMTDESVRSGYGKSAVITVFRKTVRVEVTPDYIELYDGAGRNRIYMPEEDRARIREHILSRLPDTTIRVET